MGNKTTTIWYTLGEAEKATGIPRTRLDHACRVNRLPFRRSETGARLLSHDVIEKLRKHGLKAFPRPYDPAGGPLITEGGNGSRPSSVLENRRERVQELVLETQELRARRDLRELQAEDQEAEEQHKAEAQAAALGEKRELERLQLEAARGAEARRQKTREAKAQHRRQKWEIGWTDYALKLLPQDAPRSLGLEVHQTVAEALSKLQPDQSGEITKRLVHAAVERALDPWRRRKEIEKIIAEATHQLPWLARGTFGQLSKWDARAMRAAADAIAQLESGAPVAKIRAAAIEAAGVVAREYEASKAAEEQSQTCQRLADSVYLLGGTLAEDQAGRKAVKEALDKVPVGASRAELEQVKNAALEPFHAAIAERQDAARATAQAAADVDGYLGHIHAYVEELAANDETGVLALGDFSARYQRAQELKQRLRPILIEKLKQQPLSEAQARKFIEESIEDELDLGSVATN